MKLLDVPQVAQLNAYLRSVKINDTKISGAVEVYSAKVDARDRKLSQDLEQRYVEELSTSPSVLSKSPIGDMTDGRIRKTLISLITTLNASFPDYDFSSVKAEDFTRETNLSLVANSVNMTLSEVADHYGDGFLSSLWQTITNTISIEECEVYSYVPDYDTDPQSEGKLWSFNYFFFNKSTKRVLFFYCDAQRLSLHRVASSPSSDDSFDGFEEEELGMDMDI